MNIEELHEQQRKLEDEMVDAGYTRYMKLMREAKAGKRESGTAHGRNFVAAAASHLSDAIKDWVERTGRAKRGPHALAYHHLKSSDPDLIAVIALRAVLDHVDGATTLQNVMHSIGREVEAELRLREFKKQERLLFDWTDKSLRRRTSNHAYRQRVFLDAIHGEDGNVTNAEPWTGQQRVYVGSLLYALIEQSTGAVERVNVRTGVKTSLFAAFTGEFAVMLEEAREDHALMSPFVMPCVVPPQRWDTDGNGGFWYARSLLDLVSHPVKDMSWKAWRRVIEENPEVQSALDAMNIVQETGWQVNPKVLDVMTQAWDSAMRNMPIPQRDVEERPGCPKCGQQPDAHHACFEGDEATLIKWKQSARDFYTHEARMKGKRLTFARRLNLASRFSEYEAIYFPHQMDFRGRMYPLSPLLNPQGDDTARGLLRFSEGQPVNTEDGAKWFFINGANLYGVDKVSLGGREQWVYDNMGAILASADSPLDFTWWTAADKPWQFLAWCFEVAELRDNPETALTHLPVQQDGSCNGLQHYSAMLLDEVGGVTTNLVPADLPQDIYQVVCDKVVLALEALSEAGDETAKCWLTLKLDRKTTKRSVMVVPYGGTQRACFTYLKEWLREQGPEANPWTKGSRVETEALQLLTGLVWQAIGETVIKAREAMDWIRNAAKVASKRGIGLRWTVPDGFTVAQKYFKTSAKRIVLSMGGSHLVPEGKQLKATLRTPTAKVDGLKQANASAPNFVHSMDGYCLREYVRQAYVQGIRSFSLIHDSYGTHPDMTSLSNETIRRSFYETYTTHDILLDLKEELEELLGEDLPELPNTGSLNLADVMASVYFFS